MNFSVVPVLTVGFDGAVLSELRNVFHVVCAISEDPTADVNWRDLHELSLSVDAPLMTAEMRACLAVVRGCYLQFNDINSRRYYYVPGRESETYNGFMLTFYKVFHLLKSHQIGLILHSNIPHEGFDFILHQVACFLGIRSVMCYQALIPNRFWLTDSMSEFGYFKRNPVLFDREPSGYSLPSNWFYMKGSDKDAAYGLSVLLCELARRPYRLPLAMVRYIYARQYRAQVADLTQERVIGESYLYFPLHLQPELTTSALGGDFADQLLALETLSGWLPEGYKIYLKENPKQTEKQRDPHFYKRLAGLQNVRLLGRHENSVELIRHSLGVVTITGTAGWEALFYGKPVITFGAAWYRSFPGVFEFSLSLKFDDFVQSPALVSELLVDALDEALQTAGKGVIDSAYAELVDGFDQESNATQVVDSLMRYVSRSMA